MKVFLLLIAFSVLLILQIGCSFNNENIENNSSSVKSEVESKKEESNILVGDTIHIDYNTKKQLLEIICFLPDSVFSSWAWSQVDRNKFRSEIKEYGYYIDNDPNFFNILKMESDILHVSVVDGTWKILLYQLSATKFLILTVDKVGDGSEYNFYLFENGRLNELNRSKVLPIKNAYLKERNLSDCHDFKFNPDLVQITRIKPNRIKLYFSDIDNKCYENNTLHYVLTDEDISFKLVKSNWEESE